MSANARVGLPPCCDHLGMRIFIALAAVLIACTPPVAVRTPSPSSTAIPTTTPSATRSVPATTTPAPSPTAPPVLLGAVQADLDCDDRADDLQFFEIERGKGTPVPAPDADKLARLTLASGAVHELRFEGIPQVDGGGNPLIGTADVNGDGCADAIITVGRGASTTWTAFLIFDGTRLLEADEAGKPAIFLFDGSIRHGDAIECRRTKDTTEVVARAISNYTSEFQWDVVERVYRWSSRTTLALFAIDRSVIAVATADAEPPEPGRYWGLACGGVRFPGWAFTR